MCVCVVSAAAKPSAFNTDFPFHHLAQHQPILVCWCVHFFFFAVTVKQLLMVVSV